MNQDDQNQTKSLQASLMETLETADPKLKSLLSTIAALLLIGAVYHARKGDPPKVAARLLSFFARAEDLDPILGDFGERYRNWSEQFGKRRANWHAYKDAFGSIAPLVMNRLLRAAKRVLQLRS